MQKDSGSQSRKQSHPSELSENYRKGDSRSDKRPERERQIEQLIGVRTQVLQHLSGARKGERGGSKRYVRGRATARGALWKDGYIRVIKGEEVRRDDPVEYFLPTRVGSTSWVPEGVMVVEVLQNEEISGGEKKGWGKGVGSAIRSIGANRGAYTLRNESEEELLREMLTPT